LMHNHYSRQSLSFIFGVALLPTGLDSTPAESHSNTSMAPLPTSLVSTPVELLASPLCTGSLSLLFPYSFFIFFTFFIFYFCNCAWHLFISYVEEGSRLIERGCSNRELVYYTFDVPIKVFHLTLLYLTKMTRINPKTTN